MGLGVEAATRNWTDRVPVPAFLGASAFFHYFGPSIAVLLFAFVDVMGVAWLRIASAAVVLAVWRRPWRLVRVLGARQWVGLVGLGVVLAAMNSTFYLAIERLPLSTVGAIEFLGVIGVAAFGVRDRRNLAALVLAVGGVAALVEVRVVDAPLGFGFAFANCVLFVGYVVVGHRVANAGGIGVADRLAVAMVVAAVVATPFGVGEAVPALLDPGLLGAGVAAGVCSSVIPYLCDQVVMARVSRPSFATMLCLLPASATVVGLVVLVQWPSVVELLGVGLVVVGVALHRPGS
ncbi:EamA family transporter [Stackebrandtia nassauensis]|uniref:EamA domain-containing protein n=1 Tax=Stackebrandtia nassauensis (strain DSM 44728 / CIP 108903 / NRRL B-16338 / NBRC 102104 / LLR-40K-21) TaxID=446470 RepID=D3PZ96_STANL|nr:membrane protein [Stackebrandtia nassauensis]ADD41570.1 conserved hypothetical protein [Stackebrandtia nassauensis DSM 44728]